jgi:uncharacterized repeat protein (TIGR03833 family)
LQGYTLQGKQSLYHDFIYRPKETNQSSPYQYVMMVRKAGPVNGTQRINIKPGSRVLIVLKTDQRSGKLTEGVVKDLLTNSAAHPHGIKVRLENGQVGRVKEVK